MSGLKKQSFLKGAAILVLANAIVKIIGAIFKIPLANVIEEEGMSIFNTAYNLYAALFVVATAGLPVAVSKMVSESIAKRNYTETRKIFKAAVSLLSIIGIIGTLVLFFGARTFANSIVKSPNSYLSILAVAPAIFFVSILSAFRGYFQGFSNMIPTALSEVTEALGKLVIGLGLAYILLPSGVVNASAGAVLGVTAGTFLACLVMFATYLKNRQNMITASLSANVSSRSTRKIFMVLLGIAIPITIGAAVSSLTNIIDMVMIRQRLQSIVVTQDMYQTLTEYFGLSSFEVVIGDFMKVKPSEILYGSYSGFAVPMFNLPPTIVMALSMSVVPAISGAFALKNHNQTCRLTESTIRLTTLFSLPCAVGLSVLSMPILAVMYNNTRSYSMLSILSYAVIFVCLVSVTTAILQATGNVMIPVKNMLIGGVVKILTNYILIAIPTMHINGAPISTNLCYLTIAVLNIMAIQKIIKPNLNTNEFVVKPILATITMGVGAYFSYQAIAKFLGIPMLKTALEFMPSTLPVTPVDSSIRMKMIIGLAFAIFVGVLVYAIMLFVLKCVKRDDVIMLPKGEQITKILDKFKLLT